MPQEPLSIGTLNNTTQLPAVDLPVDPTWVVEVQPPDRSDPTAPRRAKISVADIIGGGGGVAGSGTATHVALWSNGTTIDDSIITDDGTTAEVGGDFSVTGDSVMSGDLDVQGAFSAVNFTPSGFSGQSIAVGLTAVGTTRADALALTKQTNIVATAASATVGVVLPSAATIGVGNWVDVYNDGPSNAFHVYAAGSDTIDGTAGATGKNLTNAFWCRYLVTAALTFVSFRSPITRSA